MIVTTIGSGFCFSQNPIETKWTGEHLTAGQNNCLLLREKGENGETSETEVDASGTYRQSPCRAFASQKTRLSLVKWSTARLQRIIYVAEYGRIEMS